MNETQTPTLDALLAEIERACEITGTSQTRFCYESCGDPALITKMRRGRHLRPDTRRRIEAHIRSMLAKWEMKT